MNDFFKKFILCSVAILITFSVLFCCDNVYFNVDATSNKSKSNITIEKPNVKSSKIKSTSVKLKWSKIKGATSYKIYRSTNKKKWKCIKTTSKTSFTVKNLKPNKKYYFKVRAYKNKKKSSFSKIVTAKTKNVNSSVDALNSNGDSFNKITFVDNFECRLKEVNWYSPSDFDFDVVEHEEGFEYIVVVLSEKNTSNETQNAPMVNILAADGVQCVNVPVLSLYKKKYKINFGATLPNTTAEAYVLCKIPAGAKSFKLQILSNGFGTASDYIVFSRSDIK